VDPARESAVAALAHWDPAKRFAKDLLAEHGERLVEARDRALATEIVLGVARHRATIDHLLDGVSMTPLPRLDPVVRAALRAALLQILFLDRVPAHAAVDASVEIVKAQANARLAGFTNGVLRTLLRNLEGPATGAEDPRRDLPRAGAGALRFRNRVFPDVVPTTDRNRAVRFAHPEWLVARWRVRHGEEVSRTMLEAGIARGATDEAFAARLEPLLDARAGDRILSIVAVRKGVVARERGAGAVDVPIAKTGPLPYPPAAFHAVVIDAPCSNTGVLARRPETRDRLREADLAGFAAGQRALLERVWPLLRTGGRVVYVTRSVEPEENSDVLAAFSAAHPEARLEPGFDVLPSIERDGGFGAVLLVS
jgi:16S rRNA (cytosine967-C5)-methyltransferase